MTLALSRPLAVVDLETTSAEVATARIVEVAVVTVFPNGTRVPWHTRVNPEIPIPAEATAVHGISDADVAAAPTFRAIAPDLVRRLTGVDLAGYNLRRFDLGVLDAELTRVGLAAPWDDSTGIVDGFEIFTHLVPKGLSDAVRRFVGREHVGAHSALADVEATLDVIAGQLAAAPDLPRTVAELEAAVAPEDARAWVDPTRKLKRRGDGEIEIAFSKNKGQTLKQAELNFLRWILEPSRAFHPRVLSVVRAEIERRGGRV